MMVGGFVIGRPRGESEVLIRTCVSKAQTPPGLSLSLDLSYSFPLSPHPRFYHLPSFYNSPSSLNLSVHFIYALHFNLNVFTVCQLLTIFSIFKNFLLQKIFIFRIRILIELFLNGTYLFGPTLNLQLCIYFVYLFLEIFILDLLLNLKL